MDSKVGTPYQIIIFDAPSRIYKRHKNNAEGNWSNQWQQIGGTMTGLGGELIEYNMLSADVGRNILSICGIDNMTQFIQDNIEKEPWKLYFDKITGGLYECLNPTRDTSVTNNFRKFSLAELQAVKYKSQAFVREDFSKDILLEKNKRYLVISENNVRMNDTFLTQTRLITSGDSVINLLELNIYLTRSDGKYNYYRFDVSSSGEEINDNGYIFIRID